MNIILILAIFIAIFILGIGFICLLIFIVDSMTFGRKTIKEAKQNILQISKEVAKERGVKCRVKGLLRLSWPGWISFHGNGQTCFLKTEISNSPSSGSKQKNVILRTTLSKFIFSTEMADRSQQGLDIAIGRNDFFTEIPATDDVEFNEMFKYNTNTSRGSHLYNLLIKSRQVLGLLKQEKVTFCFGPVKELYEKNIYQIAVQKECFELNSEMLLKMFTLIDEVSFLTLKDGFALPEPVSEITARKIINTWEDQNWDTGS